MKTTKLFSENSQSAHLNSIVNLLVAQFSPSQIYQYAYWAVHSQRHSIFTEEQREEQEVFYLLLLSEQASVTETRVQAYIDNHYTLAKVMVHVQELAAFWECLAQGNCFYLKVFNQGNLLHGDNHNSAYLKSLVLPSNDNSEHLQDFWSKRKQTARSFLAAAELLMEDSNDRSSLLLLHTVIEQLCLGLIFVRMGYQSPTYHLKHLLYSTACFSALPRLYFFGAAHSEKQFELIAKTYEQLRRGDEIALGDTTVYDLLHLVSGFYKVVDQLLVIND